MESLADIVINDDDNRNNLSELFHIHVKNINFALKK